MDREAHQALSFAEAARWDLQQQLAMTPEERLEIAKVLRDRAYRTEAPDVRAAERSK